MADQDTTEESEYVQELNARHARFVALGGNVDIQTEMKGWKPLKDLVTDQHRKVVFDLAASGLSNEDVADVMGISKERLQALFPVEIKTAFQLCMASMARSLYVQGLAGNERAATNWLTFHNRSKWIKKTSIQGDDTAPPVQVEHQAAKGTIVELIKGMMTDPKLKGKSKSVDKPDARAQNAEVKKRVPKKPKRINKVRSENEEVAPVENPPKSRT